MMRPEKAGGKATLSATGSFGASLSRLLGGAPLAASSRWRPSGMAMTRPVSTPVP